MSREKIILFIFEGITDEDSLSGILKKLFQNQQIKFAIVRSDLTIEKGIDTTKTIKNGFTPSLTGIFRKGA
ncbi:MAG: hypothetical protein CVU92_05300 [Firmicutes bacterium HGW-Firmicutes-17]|nr:MAG: hypothetical protein CVU92_05300 [Firmicutes bacterium HGW-Firmicutes-17]